MLKLVGFAAALLAAGAAGAADLGSASQGYQEVIGFDDVAAGTTSLTYHPGGDTGFGHVITGGTVVTGTALNPARSGAQALGGTSIEISLNDPINYSWPAVGAWVTGAGTITLHGYDFNPDTLVDDEVFAPVSVGGGTTHFFLSLGSEQAIGYFTRWTFSSDEYFTLDDMTLGLVDVGPGIPEPTSWALLLVGFAGSGTALRWRRIAGRRVLA